MIFTDISKIDIIKSAVNIHIAKMYKNFTQKT